METVKTEVDICVLSVLGSDLVILVMALAGLSLTGLAIVRDVLGATRPSRLAAS
jgi:hypothetical protein